MKPTIVERIEQKAAELMLEMKNPTKVYLGKKEYKEMHDSFLPIERRPATEHMKAAYTDPKLVGYNPRKSSGIITIVPTKHKSYFRVV